MIVSAVRSTSDRDRWRRRRGRVHAHVLNIDVDQTIQPGCSGPVTSYAGGRRAQQYGVGFGTRRTTPLKVQLAVVDRIGTECDRRRGIVGEPAICADVERADGEVASVSKVESAARYVQLL